MEFDLLETDRGPENYVSQDFIDEFVRLSFANEDTEKQELVEENGNIKAYGNSGELTRLHEPDELTASAASTFGMSVPEAYDFEQRLDRFKSEGARNRVIESKLQTLDLYRENNQIEDLHAFGSDLRTEDFSLGKDVWNFLENPQSDLLAARSGAFGQIVSQTSDNAEKILQESLDGKYLTAATQAYSNHRSDVDHLFGLSQLLGNDPDLNMFKTSFNWLKGKQAQELRTNRNSERDIDISELAKNLSKDLDSQIRSKTLQAASKLGANRAGDIIHDITGNYPEDISDNEDLLHAARAYLMTENQEDKEILKHIIQHNREAYFKENSPSYDLNSTMEIPVVDNLTEKNETTVEIDNDQYTLYVASPLEGIRYGDEFDTCKSIAWEETVSGGNSGPIKRAADIRHPIIYAENEDGEIVGREIASLRDNSDIRGKYVEKLAPGTTYTGLESHEKNTELKEEIRNYLEKIRLSSGLPRSKKYDDLLTAMTLTGAEGEWMSPEGVSDKY